jgi:hypothetical protein
MATHAASLVRKDDGGEIEKLPSESDDADVLGCRWYCLFARDGKSVRETTLRHGQTSP